MYARSTALIAYDPLLEVAVKLALPQLNRSDRAHALARYGAMVSGDLLSVSMAMDEAPGSE
jgi:hypothetical protein